MGDNNDSSKKRIHLISLYTGVSSYYKNKLKNDDRSSVTIDYVIPLPLAMQVLSNTVSSSAALWAVIAADDPSS